MSVELGEYARQHLVYEKEHLLLSSTGTHSQVNHDHNVYRRAGKAVGVKAKGQGETEQAPIDRRSLLP